MTYLFYGKDKYLIDQELNKLKKQFNDISIINYDLNTDNLKNIIDECNSISLFSDKKLVIVNNTNIFNRRKSNDEVSEEIELENTNNLDDDLINYLDNQNKDVELIFINNQETIDNNKKITKLIKNKGVIKEFNTINIKNIVKDMLNDYKITYDDINLLIERVGNDLETLSCEINKIITYKGNDKQITKEDIINLTYLSIDVSAFNFVDQIANKNKKEALKIYDEMLTIHNDPSKIIPLLASKIRLIYQVSELSRMGYTLKQMQDTLQIKEYPIKLALKTASYTTKENILKNLLDLANLEIDIKSGVINAELGIQLFILNA